MPTSASARLKSSVTLQMQQENIARRKRDSSIISLTKDHEKRISQAHVEWKKLRKTLEEVKTTLHSIGMSPTLLLVVDWCVSTLFCQIIIIIRCQDRRLRLRSWKGLLKRHKNTEIRNTMIDFGVVVACTSGTDFEVTTRNSRASLPHPIKYSKRFI